MDQHLKTSATTEGLEPGEIQVNLRGQFTWLHGKQFRSEFERALKSGYKTIELDFRELSYLDSTALSEILSAKKMAEDAGGKIRIVNPRKLIRHIFVSAKLDQVLEIGPAYTPTDPTDE